MFDTHFKGLGLLLAVVALSALLMTAQADADGPTVFVRLTADDAVVQALDASQVIDYGDFVWLELPVDALAQLDAAGLSYQVYRSPFTLRLGGQSFDPRQDRPALPAGWDRHSQDGPNFYLVQLIGPPRDGWLEGLEKVGVEVVQYIHPFTYVVWGDLTILNRATDADFIRWTGDFAPAYRVAPRWQNLPSETVAVSVLLYRGADVDAALRQLEKLSGRVTGRAVLNDTFEMAGLTIAGDRLQAAAQVPGVYGLQLEPTDGGLRGEVSNQVNVNNIDEQNRAFIGYQTWLASAGLSGAGVTIANVDSGVQETHPDLVNRFLSCSGTTCGGGVSSEHGTHTAGIMAADGSSGVVDGHGFLRGLGMAPGARLLEQLYTPYYAWTDGMLLLMRESYANGALVSGNSWGPSGSAQGYDHDTMQVDIGVRDAAAGTAGNQALIYVLSFMNGNGGVSSQGSPDEAKNILTIGSTRMQYGDGDQILAINDLSSNSAHGPALDGRTIPHLVAPGCYVDSTVPDNTYDTMCGTSMAAPHVSGAVALFVEYYRGLFDGATPSPALVKAAFLPVAHDLAGHADADGHMLGHPFDSKQGWGRLNVAAVVSPTLPVHYWDAPLLLDDTGEAWTQSVRPADPQRPVRLMLVWTDAPGHGLGGSTPAWNNDLDLVVEAEGNTCRGNYFGADGWSQAGGSADERNNTEGVFLGPAAPANFVVRVVASNINSDGVPHYGDGTDQDFALVCYNCAQEADFELRATPDSLGVCVPDVVTSTLQVNEILSYPYGVTLTTALPSGLKQGVTATISPQVVTPTGAARLTLDVSEAISAGAHTLLVSGTARVTNVHSARLTLRAYTDPPGAPTPLTPADGATDQPTKGITFAWTALPGAERHSLQWDRRPTFPAPELVVTDLVTSTFTLDTPLEPGTCYFWRVAGANACGGSAWSAPFHLATRVLEDVFSDDMESGAGKWSHRADQGSDAWTLATDQSHSPSHAWHVPDAPDYTDSYLWNRIPLTLGAGSTLAFWHLYQFEAEVDYYDGAILEISTDGGDTWVDLGPYMTTNGYNGQLSDYSPLPNHDAWVGALTDWTQVVVDLDSFAGQLAQIRWRIVCDHSVGDVGWYIDDVQVTAPQSPRPTPTVSHLAPNVGPALQPGRVQIHGSHFITTPQARLGETWLLSVTQISSTTLEAWMPDTLFTDTYTLTLYNGADCQIATLHDAFTAGAMPDLSLQHTVIPTTALPTQSVTLTLRFANLGWPTATEVLITDLVPAALSITQTYSGDATPVDGGTNRLYAWQVPALPPEARGTITLTGVVRTSAPGVYTSTAHITGAETEVLTANNRSQATLNVLPVALPVLLSPRDGALISDTMPTLVWQESPGAAGYQLDWNGVISDVGARTQYTVPAPAGATYRWRVAAYDGLRRTTPFTDIWSFTVYTPLSGLVATNDSPTLLGQATRLTATLAASSAVTYSWDLGDGTRGHGAVVSHIYPAVGVYTAVVTVSNDLPGTAWQGGQTSAATAVAVYRPFRVYLPALLCSR